MLKRNVRIFIAIGVGLLLFGLPMAYNSWNENRIKNKAPIELTDAETIEDLSLLEGAIIEKATKTHGMSLPDNLSQVNLKGLRGSITQYEYRPTQKESGGGPTVIYQICAVFDASNKIDTNYYNDGSTTDGPSAYDTHKQGRQCYENAYYKSSSHIKPID